MTQPIILVDQLRKHYGPVEAVAGISLAVQPGEIFGLVGPNGAGKTTTIECLQGLRQPDSGTVEVLGLNYRRHGDALRRRIGSQLQGTALPQRLKAWEALALFASFYPRSCNGEQLLAQVGLTDKRNTYVAHLSGGERQRLSLALALVNDPEVVFLDEMTTGLDPHARHGIWQLVKEINGQGKTILLTSHFMEEVEHLCHRVAIIDHGRIIALDSPDKLIAGLHQEQRLVFQTDDGFDPQWLSGISGVTLIVPDCGRVTVRGQGAELVSDVVGALLARGCAIRHLRTEQATLEDVFLALTSHAVKV